MAEVEWTNDLVIRLINEYKKRPELWDTQHELYRVPTAKYEAWSDMAIEFECDIADLRKKLNSVFASHRREKGKVRCGGRSTWFLYKYLSFLPNHLDSAEENVTIHIPSVEVKTQREESEHSSDNEYGNLHEEIVIKQEPVADPEYKKRNRHSKPRLTKPIRRRFVEKVSTTASKLDSRLLETLRLLRRSDLSRKKDECDSFGEYIADSLRKHEDKTQSMIKQAINNILFEQEMKKYNTNQYTVVINGCLDENPLTLDQDDK
ncbi:uncharacterized protein LOC114358010 [Ostrinia furnacalis]|uniref:uncharacterized protein LOC114358010 n=1 Tax=Ostrinia furnacalis TaxID=93504 RepID=UPI0010404C92|nr:uncharacterized protein LOC114358010 [Ostrinia furnacalis]